MDTPSDLSTQSRSAITQALNAALITGIDFYTRSKLAHWNVQGVMFFELHRFFDTLAEHASDANDRVAERIRALGGLAMGSTQDQTAYSRLSPFRVESYADRAVAQQVFRTLKSYLKPLREARDIAAQQGDPETENMLSEIVTTFEKDGFFLAATIGPPDRLAPLGALALAGHAPVPGAVAHHGLALRARRRRGHRARGHHRGPRLLERRQGLRRRASLALRHQKRDALGVDQTHLVLALAQAAALHHGDPSRALGVRLPQRPRAERLLGLGRTL
ncbi:MAG: DNA starvation/stationary phase protection protein [Rhodanobacteraceae bacterium]|nr:DNA starvation/stationary phase protection protein [Rhodanobacteraceae bacterium]